MIGIRKVSDICIDETENGCDKHAAAASRSTCAAQGESSSCQMELLCRARLRQRSSVNKAQQCVFEQPRGGGHHVAPRMGEGAGHGWIELLQQVLPPLWGHLCWVLLRQAQRFHQGVPCKSTHNHQCWRQEERACDVHVSESTTSSSNGSAPRPYTGNRHLHAS